MNTLHHPRHPPVASPAAQRDRAASVALRLRLLRLGLHRAGRRGAGGRDPCHRQPAPARPARSAEPGQSPRTVVAGGIGAGHHRPRRLRDPDPHHPRHLGLSDDDPQAGSGSPGARRHRRGHADLHGAQDGLRAPPPRPRAPCDPDLHGELPERPCHDVGHHLPDAGRPARPRREEPARQRLPHGARHRRDPARRREPRLSRRALAERRSGGLGRRRGLGRRCAGSRRSSCSGAARWKSRARPRLHPTRSRNERTKANRFASRRGR